MELCHVIHFLSGGQGQISQQVVHSGYSNIKMPMSEAVFLQPYTYSLQDLSLIFVDRYNKVGRNLELSPFLSDRELRIIID